jgi:hypothetical protein
LSHIAAAIFIAGAKRRIPARGNAEGNGELSFAQQGIQTAGDTDGAAIGSETPTNPAAPAPGQIKSIHRTRETQPEKLVDL